MIGKQCVPAVSVIVPIYKVERYLEECVDSIRNQTMDNIEIILVDDGSPDACPEMCDRFAAEDNRICVLHQTNSGVSAARNSGIKMARGEWLMFVDGDDWLERNAIEVLYQKNKEWDCDVITGARFVSYINKEVSEARADISEHCFSVSEYQINLLGNALLDFPFAKTLFLEKMSENVQLAPPWMKLYRRQLICKNGILFPVHIKWAEDMIFNMEVILKAQKVGYLNHIPIYHYRQRKSAVTKQLAVLQKEYMVTLHYMYERFIESEMLNELRPYFYMECISCAIQLLTMCGENGDSIFSQAAMIKKFVEEPLCHQALVNTSLRQVSLKKRSLGALFLKHRMYMLAVLVSRCFYRISFKKKIVDMFV